MEEKQAPFRVISVREQRFPLLRRYVRGICNLALNWVRFFRESSIAGREVGKLGLLVEKDFCLQSVSREAYPGARVSGFVWFFCCVELYCKL